MMAARSRHVRFRPHPQSLPQDSLSPPRPSVQSRIRWRAAVMALGVLAGLGCLLPNASMGPSPSDTNGISSFQLREFLVPSSGFVPEGVRGHVVVKRTRGSSVCDDGTRNNAWVLLAQKKHATYGRDSLGLLVKTLDLLRDNYLSLGNHAAKVDLFLFHTGDFTDADLVYLEHRLGRGTAAGILRLVDLNNTVYWSLPEMLHNDQQASWKGSEIYPLGYRHMCRWFGMQLWYFFQDLNQQEHQEGGCNYRYIARLDEDSFIHSPINYDMFDLMQSHHYVYAYRMCSYELDETLPKLWFKKWRKGLGNETQRFLDPELCGFYTNFFIADLEFFLSPNVTKLVREIDRRGFFYRKRFGDLLVHSLAVYAFAPPTQIHRFLDFTYEHVTMDYFQDREKECISWGSIQAGYNDPHGESLVDQFYETHVVRKDCKTANRSYLSAKDLSPTYSHLPPGKEVMLKTVHAGKVELPGQGTLSG